MTEYFIVARSFAAPFVSDTLYKYVSGNTPTEAMYEFIAGYDHPFGLYAVTLYANADACYKKEKPLFEWLSEKAIKAGWR